MGMRDMYAYAIQTAKDLRMQGAAEERDGKLHFKGTVTSEAEKNKIWDAIKTIPSWQQDVVGDIKDAAGMFALFTDHRPDVVFHAAAHKHVNLLEGSPREAILNNVLGTRNVARACDATGVETLALISTDKAVNPSSVMGASKRLCEMVLQGLARDSKTTMVARERRAPSMILAWLSASEKITSSLLTNCGRTA